LVIWVAGRFAYSCAGVAEADVVVVLMDGQAGPTAADEEVMDWLRRTHSDKKVVLAVNKCESATRGELQASLFWEFGHEPLAISAISGTGTGVLMERIVEVRASAMSTSHDTSHV
jgi:GTPase